MISNKIEINSACNFDLFNEYIKMSEKQVKSTPLNELLKIINNKTCAKCGKNQRS
jgi:hypothetical protein